MRLVVASYNLNDGKEVLHEEYERFYDALHAYELASKHYKNYHSSDNFATMFFTESGNIIFGFDDAIVETLELGDN